MKDVSVFERKTVSDKRCSIRKRKRMEVSEEYTIV